MPIEHSRHLVITQHCCDVPPASSDLKRSGLGLGLGEVVCLLSNQRWKAFNEFLISEFLTGKFKIIYPVGNENNSSPSPHVTFILCHIGRITTYRCLLSFIIILFLVLLLLLLLHRGLYNNIKSTLLIRNRRKRKKK